MTSTADQILQCFSCAAIIHPGQQCFERDVQGFLNIYTRMFCSRDCAERDEEREQEPTKEYIE